MTNSEIAAVAGRLSAAQKRRLLMLVKHPLGSKLCMTFEGHGNTACLRLVERGLAHRVGAHALGGAYQITPLGKRVASHLQEQTK